MKSDLLFIIARSNRKRRGVRVAVRDGDQQAGDAQLFDDGFGSAVYVDERLSARLVDYLHVAPTNSTPPAGTQGLEHGLLGGPAARKVLGGLLAVSAVANFIGRIDAIDKQIAVPLDHPRNSQTFGNIGANSNYVGHGQFSSKWGLSLKYRTGRSILQKETKLTKI